MWWHADELDVHGVRELAWLVLGARACVPAWHTKEGQRKDAIKGHGTLRPNFGYEFELDDPAHEGDVRELTISRIKIVDDVRCSTSRPAPAPNAAHNSAQHSVRTRTALISCYFQKNYLNFLSIQKITFHACSYLEIFAISCWFKKSL